VVAARRLPVVYKDGAEAVEQACDSLPKPCPMLPGRSGRLQSKGAHKNLANVSSSEKASAAAPRGQAADDPGRHLILGVGPTRQTRGGGSLSRSLSLASILGWQRQLGS